MSKEVTNDADKRSKEFWADYKKLVEKHKIDITSYPIFMPDGNGNFMVQIKTSLMEVPDETTSVMAKD